MADHGHGHGHGHGSDPIVVIRLDGETDEEYQWRVEHAAMHVKHAGHDVMHAEMFLVFIGVMFFAQIFLVLWKSKHFKSYQLITTIGLWLIPVAISFHKSFYRFIFFWVIFSAICGYIYRRVNNRQIDGSTPRLVYRWFVSVHQMSYILGVSGYVILMATILGANILFGIQTSTSMDTGFYLMFYGLYYGVLGRDLAQICTDRLACKIGYRTAEGLPKRLLEANVCAVCGGKIHASTPVACEPDSNVDEPIVVERLYTLSCNHSFHEFCIRGWVVVGKQETCPYCNEKVDLKRMFKNPWDKPHLFFGQLLDWIRYLVAWQPLIILVVQGINNSLGLE